MTGVADESVGPDGEEHDAQSHSEHPGRGSQGRERYRHDAGAQQGMGDEAAAGVPAHGVGDQGDARSCDGCGTGNQPGAAGRGAGVGGVLEWPAYTDSTGRSPVRCRR